MRKASEKLGNTQLDMVVIVVLIQLWVTVKHYAIGQQNKYLYISIWQQAKVEISISAMKLKAGGRRLSAQEAM